MGRQHRSVSGSGPAARKQPTSLQRTNLGARSAARRSRMIERACNIRRIRKRSLRIRLSRGQENAVACTLSVWRQPFPQYRPGISRGAAYKDVRKPGFLVLDAVAVGDCAGSEARLEGLLQVAPRKAQHDHCVRGWVAVALKAIRVNPADRTRQAICCPV